MRPQGQRIFEGKALRATLFVPKAMTETLVVSFDHRTPGRAGFAPMPSPERFHERGAARLHVQTARNDWFINTETAALEAAFSAMRGRFARVVTLGFSMGGYAALRFARGLGAMAAIAVSPQATLDPMAAPWENRYPAEARGFNGRLGALEAHVMSDLRGYVVFDPRCAPDASHAALIALRFPRVELLRLWGAGHPASTVLREAGRAGIFLDAAIALSRGQAARAALTAAHRAARVQSQTYWAALAEVAAPRRPALAQAARRRARALKESG